MISNKKFSRNPNKPTSTSTARYYSPNEEKLNSLTHLLGVIFGIIAGFFLIRKAILSHNSWAIFSDVVFITYLILMFLSSTLYHLEQRESKKFRGRKFDHAAIYAQIAGSYTPFTLIVLRENGAWGWSLFVVIWIAAVLGISLSFMNLRKGSKLETICYIAMGWVVILAIKPLIDSLSATNSMDVLWWLLCGGMFYTVGAVLYQFKKIPYMHAVWHLFVLGGGVSHFIAIWKIKI